MTKATSQWRTRLRGAICGTTLVLLSLGCAAPARRVPVNDLSRPPESAKATAPARLEREETEPVVLDDSSTLSDFLAYAAFHNAGLEAAFNRWKAELERIEQVTALPDPRFTYRYFIREVETRVGPQRQAFGLAQTFPWFEKLALKGDIATEAAAVARQVYEAEKLALFHAVQDAYYELYYLGRALDVVEENLRLVKHLETVARTRYKTAAASHPDVIRAQVELGKLEDRLAALTDLRTPLVAKLNAALNGPSHQDVPFPDSIPEAQITATDDEMLQWLAEANPDLCSLDHEAEKTRLAIDLARQDYYPDFTLGVDYTDVGSPPRSNPQGLSNPAALRSVSRLGGGTGDLIDLYSIGRSFQPGQRPNDAGQDIWMVSLSMTLPIWHGKYAAGQREARARHLAAIAARRQRHNDLVVDLQQILYRYRDAERKIDLYGATLLPKARQSLRSTEASFRTGQSGFLDLIDAERTLLEFELSYERALTNRAQRLAQLEKIVGRSLPRTDTQPPSAPSPGESPEAGSNGDE